MRKMQFVDLAAAEFEEEKRAKASQSRRADRKGDEGGKEKCVSDELAGPHHKSKREDGERLALPGD